MNFNDPVLFRLIRAFAISQRIQDLQMLLTMKLHYTSYGKLGDTNEQLLKDLENRNSLYLTKWENHLEDIEKKAIANYLSITQSYITTERTETGVEKEKTNKPTPTTSKK